MSDTNVAERLKSFIEAKGLTYSQFADRCGIPRPSLSQFLTGRNKKINDIMVGQIHSTFPDLSIVWLLFGEGGMTTPLYLENEGGASSVPREYEEGLFSTDEFVDEGSKKIYFPGNQSPQTENRKENDLNRNENTGLINDTEKDSLKKKVKELQLQIEKMKKNPRKAVKIMVYYDDFTFEEFFPT